MSSGPRFSILIGCYGDFPQYSLRAVRSILNGRTLSKGKERNFDLHVGANHCGAQTLRELRKLYDEGSIDTLIESSKNINKCPMKRLLIDRIETEFGVWFDDDSHALAGWNAALLEFIEQHPDVDVAGQLYEMQRTRRYRQFLQQRPWFVNEELWIADTRTSSHFATGGLYLFRAAFVRRHNYPDKGIIKRFDDLLLGDLITQQRGKLLPFSEKLLAKLRISDGDRRGSGEEIAAYSTLDPLTGEERKPTAASATPVPRLLDSKGTVDEPEDLMMLVDQANAFHGEGKLNEALALYREALEINSSLAELHYNIALVYTALSRNDEALQAFDTALRLRPDYAEAYNNKGNVLFGLGRFEEACGLFRKAISLEPRLFAAHNNLGNCLLRMHALSAAVEVFRQALLINPAQPEIHLNASTVFNRLGRTNEALLHARLAKHYDPNYAAARFHLAFLWLKVGYFEEAWEELEWRRQTPLWRPPVGLIPDLPQSLSAGAALTVYQEGSVTDALLFLRFLGASLKSSSQTTFVCSPAVAGIARLIPGLTVVDSSAALPAGTRAVPLFSLPRLLGADSPKSLVPISPCCIPELEAVTLPVQHRMDLKVGVSWKAARDTHPLFNCDFSIADLHELLTVPGTSVFALADTITTEERTALNDRANVKTLEVSFENLKQLALWVNDLNLLITTSNQAAYLAGLLGKECWLLLREPSSWTWPDGSEYSPWLPSLKIYRVATGGEEQTFKIVARDLENFAQQHCETFLTVS